MDFDQLDESLRRLQQLRRALDQYEQAGDDRPLPLPQEHGLKLKPLTVSTVYWRSRP